MNHHREAGLPLAHVAALHELEKKYPLVLLTLYSDHLHSGAWEPWEGGDLSRQGE